MVNVSQVSEVGKDQESLPVSTRLYILIGTISGIGLLSSFAFERGIPLLGMLGIILFMSAFVAQVFFLSNKRFELVAVFSSAIAIALPFITLISPLYGLGVLLLALFLFHGIHRGHSVVSNMVNIHLFRAGRTASGSVLSGVIIFLCAVLILTSNFTISEYRTRQIVGIASPAVRQFIPDFVPEMSVNEFLRVLALREAANEPRFSELPPAVQEQVIEDSVLELERRAEEYFGEDINPGLSVTQNIHTTIRFKLESLTPITKFYWSIAVIALVWLSLKTVQFALQIPIVLLSILIYELLIAIKFGRVEHQTGSKEVIVME